MTRIVLAHPATLLLVFLTQGAWGQVAELCVPDCSQASEGDRVRDPSNCLNFYYCSDPTGNSTLQPSQDPITCPDGYYFNSDPTTMRCEEIVPNTDYCSDLCSPCLVECVNPGSLLPDPANCNLYRVCLAKRDFLLEECPASYPYFDYQTSSCVDDPSVCYNVCDPCKVYCTAPGKVPDPYNCYAYYLCDPPTTTSFLCPTDDVFNPETLVCEPGSTCVNTCQP